MTSTTATTTTTTAKTRSDGVLLMRLVRELAPDRSAFVFAVVLYLPLTALSVLQPLVIGRAVDEGFRQADVAAVSKWAGVFVLLVAGRAVVEAVQGLMMQALGQGAVRRMRVRLFQKLQRLPLSFFDRQPLGKLMTRVTNDTESVAELFSSGAVSLVGDALYLVGTICMLFAVDVELSAASLVVLPPLAVGVQWVRRRSKIAFGRVRTALSQMNATLQELLSGMSIVQLFARVDESAARLEKENAAYTLANKEAIFLDAGIYSFVDAISIIAIAITLGAAHVIGVAGVDVDGVLSLGVLVAFVDALGRFFLPIRELSNKTTIIQSALVAADRIVELEDEPEPITSPPSPVEAVFTRELRFDDVHFSYDEGPPVLRGLSFTVKKGERVALVGHTGTGKSTVVKLVPRLYDVNAGRILVDDVDVRAFDPRALRRLTTAVPQDTFLFHGTIRDNLRFGAPGASDARLLEAAKACCADDVIERHGGLDGAVSERGQSLSLGERQLLALTRALVSDPPIVILDEATASVDRETERRLQLAQEKLIAGRTALIVAHRLSTIEKCDRILLMHEGRVLEEGTHDELVKKGGRYAALVELQRTQG
ncbi:MAG: ABC transporter ATP-binding protein [Deltaproteobacteria bacterium]|nr:ABC transporter ATP-binding protein [Deltaproteobacteria bacterium]